jgi:U3 small nucleolar RNA-associated protein 23
VRKIPGIPLIYLHGNAPTLERPSAMTESLTERIADGKTSLSQHQRQIIAALKQEVLGSSVAGAAVKTEKKKKRRGPKGPNPLSCKKKKKRSRQDGAPPTQQQINELKKRKRRSRKKTAASHVSQPVPV